jgi:t-SNARE complex subunit (syntaxin)
MGSDISAGTLSIRRAASRKIRVRSAPRLFVVAVVVVVVVVVENRGRM